MPRAYTWDQLRRLSTARQFPTGSGRGVPRVGALADRIGPMQTQTARSTFLGLAARDPRLDHATIRAAFEGAALVRGSTLRGTVHTATPMQHVLLETATRIGQRPLWQRTLRPRAFELEDLWADLAAFAAEKWRTPAELAQRLLAYVDAHDPQAGRIDPAAGFGRYLAFGYGGLVRRPMSGGWEGQGSAGYRSAEAWVREQDAALGAATDRVRVRPAADRLDELVALHLRSYGPATRDDISWWSGLRLGEIDAALVRLADRLTTRPGPDGRIFHDLAEGTPRPREDDGVRLLPEFDAVLCGYQPKARDRFVAPHHHAVLWNIGNGLCRAPVLHRGRVSGYWRLEGAGRSRRLEVTSFPDTKPPDLDALAEPAQGVSRALDLDIDDIRVLAA